MTQGPSAVISLCCLKGFKVFEVLKKFKGFKVFEVFCEKFPY